MVNNIKQFKNKVTAFLSWWVAELIGMVPVTVSNFFNPEKKLAQIMFAKKQTIITFPRNDDEETKTFDLTFPEVLDSSEFKIFLSKQMDLSVIVLLSEDLILERQITLPKAAKNNLKKIVTLQLPRLLPMKEQDIYFDCQSIDAVDKDLITVNLSMIKRSLGDEILSAINQSGLRAKSIKGLVKRGEGSTYTFLNLVKKHKLQEGRITAGLVTGLIFLSLFFIGLYYVKLSDREAFLGEQITHLSQEVKQIEALSEEIQNFDQQQALYKSKIEYLRLDEVLSSLAVLLPDDSWVFDFAMNGDRLTIAGKTTNSSLLVEKIDSSPYFKNVINSSTRISNTPGNISRERFSISFDLIERAR